MMFQIAVDIGGPRKEFFRLILNEIKEKYFDKGLREHLESDNVLVGKVMGEFNQNSLNFFFICTGYVF